MSICIPLKCWEKNQSEGCITLGAVSCEVIVFHRQALAFVNLCIHTRNLFTPKGEVVVQENHVVPFTDDVVDLNSAHNLCCMSSALLFSSCLHQKHAILGAMLQKSLLKIP